MEREGRGAGLGSVLGSESFAGSADDDAVGRELDQMLENALGEKLDVSSRRTRGGLRRGLGASGASEAAEVMGGSGVAGSQMKRQTKKGKQGKKGVAKSG